MGISPDEDSEEAVQLLAERLLSGMMSHGGMN